MTTVDSALNAKASTTGAKALDNAYTVDIASCVHMVEREEVE